MDSEAVFAASAIQRRAVADLLEGLQRGIDLPTAACGQASVLARLEGPGVVTLRRRLKASGLDGPI